MAEFRNDVTLDIHGRQKDVWVNINRSKKELSFSLSGGGYGYAVALTDTRENWESKPTFVPRKGMIIVYTDYEVINRQGQDVLIPGIKIGDGSAYLVDLPFAFENWNIVLEDHINNDDIHVSRQEKDFWNAKLNYELDKETLIFTQE